MGPIDFLLQRFVSRPNSPAVALSGGVITYGQIASEVQRLLVFLESNEVDAGARVVLKGDYSILSVPMLLALIQRCCIVIPLTPATYDTVEESLPLVAANFQVDVTGAVPAIKRLKHGAVPELCEVISNRGAPGLVLFTSGSSGKPKAVVHDFSKLLEKFHTIRPAMITLNFLLFDHWGGLNTLLHSLSNLCLIVFPEKRIPEYVCDLIEKYRIELLPATPSFINVLLVSRSYVGKDLSSLKLITYGAEPMADSTLKGLSKAFPNVELRQTYGMIELGVLRAKSRSSDSLWVKLGGEGYNVRVVDGILQIKADSAMLGYIGAESPFTDDGFLITGDLVETDGEWVRILGRQSDLINVGGQKVYPTEVEAVILDCPDILDAVVYGEPNPLLGKVVCADLILAESTDEADARRLVRRICTEKLQAYMVPAKIRFVKEIAQSHRLKRVHAKA